MRSIVLACGLVSILAASVSAATYLVKSDGSGDFPTIQAAADSASDGDVIELADGIFSGPGNYNVLIEEKEITIRSASGNPEACIIDCFENSTTTHRALVIISEGEMTGALRGLTIRNGYADGGGAVATAMVGLFTFENCVFENNVANCAGGAVYAGNDIQLTSCVLRNNGGPNACGGGIIVDSYWP